MRFPNEFLGRANEKVYCEHNFSMRRILTIFLTIVLSFQLSWAEAAVHCQHENSPVAVHFGHHVHRHLVKDPRIQKGKDVAKVSVDNDCAVCHLSSSAVTSPLTTLPVVEPAEHSPAVAVILYLTSTYPHRPERPKWVDAPL